jgi:effector-binding domain-containing protein
MLNLLFHQNQNTMKALKIIGITVLVIILIIVGYGMTLSGEAHLERSIVINAPVEKVFKEVNTFKTITAWSPWTKIDPEMKTEFTGPTAGIGAKYSWESDNSEVGIGSQEILESRKNEYVKSKMDFGIDGDFYAEFILEPVEAGTNLTWTYEGKVESLLWKYLLLGMDGQLGPMYEQGLADLKNYIEGLPDYSIIIEELEADAIAYIGIRVPMPTNTEEIGPKMGQLYGQLGAFMGQNSIAQAGMPMTVYYINDDGSMDMEVAMPTSSLIDNMADNIIAKNTPTGHVLKGIHMGDYNNLHSSYEEILKYAEDNDYEQAAAMYEIYVTDPGEVDTTNWQTDIYIPVRKKE